jgi:xanthine/CO dehydrogenase XdhC/CoxF family maturation factor
MAVSILAEMLAARGHHSGRALKATKGAIHASASA